MCANNINFSLDISFSLGVNNNNNNASGTVVNVSSLLAVKAFPGWGMYAMAKAGRDMLHQVIAAEAECAEVDLYIGHLLPPPTSSASSCKCSAAPPAATRAAKSYTCE